MLAEEIEGTIAGDPGRGGLITAALIAVATMAGRIDKNLATALAGADGFDLVHRNGVVLLAEMEDYGAFRLFLDEIDDAAAIIGRGGGDARRHRLRPQAQAVAPASGVAIGGVLGGRIGARQLRICSVR